MQHLKALIPVLLLAAMASTEAHAYIGPGAGISLLGSLFGILAVLGLALWAMLRWAFQAVVPAALRRRSETAAPAPAMHGAAPASTADPSTTEHATGSGIVSKLSYVFLGVLVASAFSYPRDLAVSWMNASSYIARGFLDPVLEFHTEPARFPPDEAGVVTYDPDLASHGLNLELSASEPEARLFDMDGRLLHRWHLETEAISRAWAAVGEPVSDLSGLYWRRAKPLSDGSLLVVLENPSTTPYAMGMMKLDWESNVLWMAPARYHHSLDVGPDGRIYTLYQELATEPVEAIAWIEPPFLNEGVAILGPGGTELDRINIVDAFVDTPLESYLFRVLPDAKGDSIHLNAVTLVTPEIASRSRIAEAGQLLVSIRELSTVAVIDPSTRKVVWAESDLWAEQHDPVLTSGHNVLVFDNLGPGNGTSRAIEWDTSQKTVAWEWAGTEDLPLASVWAGTVALLPNGNRMITESYGGRAVEVTENGKIAWEWRTDRRFGDDRERIGHLMEMIRLPFSFFEGRNVRLAETMRATR